jgi:hypothetical protein
MHKLSIDELQVESYMTEDVPHGGGTVDAFETEPASAFNPCTGVSCTYPVQLCRTCHCAAEERPEAERVLAGASAWLPVP